MASRSSSVNSRPATFSASARTSRVTTPASWAFAQSTPGRSVPPKPSWGIGFPVIITAMKIAGTMNAKMSTQYWATWV